MSELDNQKTEQPHIIQIVPAFTERLHMVIGLGSDGRLYMNNDNMGYWAEWNKGSLRQINPEKEQP